ncbi:hypothetical protein BJX76DRAFT_345057 [Aspergillus varians]
MTSTYAPDQLEAYLQRIAYPNASSKPGHTRLQQLQRSIQEDALATLAELQRRHLGSIPWGNSALHYSQHHTISTHPSAVFEKLVVRRLDGYCMENTSLLYVVLRSLGYRVYPSAARVSSAATDPKNAGPEISYTSLYKYMVCDDCRYGGILLMLYVITNIHPQVDVGFGNNCPTRPLPLEENAMAVNIAPAEMRLTKESLPEAVDQSQTFWIYQIRFNAESKWVPLYAFSEVEFLPQDFAMMNFQTSQMPSSWFTQTVLCVSHILDETGSELERFLHHLRPTASRPFRSPIFSPPAFPASRAMSTSIQKKLDALRNYSACDVSDALLKLQKPAPGSPPRAGYLADFTPFSPTLGRNTTEPKIIGEASTIRFIPKSSPSPEPESDASPHTFPPGKHWVDCTTPGTIVLIEQPAGQHCAVVGGIMAVRMKTLGVKGVVVNGRIRDLSEIHAAGLPVWAAGTSTVGTGAEAKAGFRDVRVEFGGVGVEAGDIIFCDPLEGVVAIPRDLLDQVLEVMPKLIAMDDKVKEAVEQGSSVYDAFKKFRG